MLCPTCDHTMEKINTVRSSSDWFWCPRCGTIREQTHPQGWIEDSVPLLVERCREFCKKSPIVSDNRGEFTSGRLWISLGIAEIINTPENRP